MAALKRVVAEAGTQAANLDDNALQLSYKITPARNQQDLKTARARPARRMKPVLFGVRPVYLAGVSSIPTGVMLKSGELRYVDASKRPGQQHISDDGTCETRQGRSHAQEAAGIGCR